ncbi:hypothetical protein NMY22_g5546 [Coprinellus aureogranulatus]|nr:hypothetical protein NMY22_g5546 [Coprinellus aureogranulatus]
MPICSNEYTLGESMTATTSTIEPVGKKDEVYYWDDNVTFSVEDVLFRVSRYPFLLGSEHFVTKYGLAVSNGCDSQSAVRLEGVTAADFRVFLKFLFPVHLTSTVSTYTKDEWLVILALSVRWHFHEARKLAIQHLDGQLTDVELVLSGRAAYVPRWVLAGYRAIVERPRQETIADEVGEQIGHREMNGLWAIRYHCAVTQCGSSFAENALRRKFSIELAELSDLEAGHCTAAEPEARAQEGVLQEYDERRRRLSSGEQQTSDRASDDDSTARQAQGEDARRVPEAQSLGESGADDWLDKDKQRRRSLGWRQRVPVTEGIECQAVAGLNVSRWLSKGEDERAEVEVEGHSSESKETTTHQVEIPCKASLPESQAFMTDSPTTYSVAPTTLDAPVPSSTAAQRKALRREKLRLQRVKEKETLAGDVTML